MPDVRLRILGAEGHGLETSYCLPQFLHLQQSIKKIQTSHNLFRDLEQIKHSQLVGQAAEIKFESKFKPLLVILQSLLKAVPEDNRRF